MTSDERIKDRIGGRKAADAVLELAQWEGESREWMIAFWCQIGIRLHAAEKMLDLVATPPRQKLVPMSDGEARLFAEMPMPFGKYKDTVVWAVMQEDDGYLDWLVRATEEDHFKDNLRRYLARPEFLNEDSGE